ncbi:MAG: hypothetical protein DME87_09485 [Verrucomicrobia bacterium]|nr:MAG: hypothetical protein DME87_09485 [Verrucomicrobiota bacterium]
MLNKKREIAETRNRRPVDEGKSGVMALSKRRYFIPWTLSKTGISPVPPTSARALAIGSE